MPLPNSCIGDGADDFRPAGLGLLHARLAAVAAKIAVLFLAKWAGVTVFFLALLRLVWWATHQPPALPGHMSTLERWGAKLGHFALYALMVAIPLSGWLMSSAKGIQTVWFGVLPLPDLLEKKQRNWQCLANFARRFESDANCRTAGPRCRSAQVPLV